MKTPIVMLLGKARSGKDTAGAVLAKELGGMCIALADPMKRFLADPEGFGLTVEQLWGEQKGHEFLRRAPTLGQLLPLAEAHLGIADPDDVDVLGEAIEKWAKSLPSPTTPRHIMQTFGTECVRESLSPDFWIDYALEVAENLLLGYGNYDREHGVTDDEEQRTCNLVVLTDGRFRNEALPVKQVGGSVVRIRRDATVIGVVGAGGGVAAQHASEAEQDSIPDWWCDAIVMNEGNLETYKGRVKGVALAMKSGELDGKYW